MNRYPRIFILILLTSLGGVMPARAAEIPDRVVIPSRPGAVTFSHSGHAGIACRDCHHTSTGTHVEAGCRACHTKTSRHPRNSHQAFHDSCIGCHAQRKQAGQKTGPVKLCSQCHAR